MGLIDSLKRWQLARQGLSSGRKRRIYSENPAIQAVEESWIVRAGIALGFVVLTAALIARTASDLPDVNGLDRGAFGLAMAAAAVAVFRSCARSFYCFRSSRASLVLGGSLGHVVLCVVIERLVGSWAPAGPAAPNFHYLLIPYALAPMLLGVLLGRTIGLLSTIYVSLAGALMVESETAIGYLLISLLSGTTAVMLSDRVRKRGELLNAGIWAGVVALLVAMAWRQVQIPGHIGPDSVAHAKALLAGGFAVMGASIFTALIVSGLLPVFESLFKLTTNITWLELSDLNHRLLRRMQLEAPGTFHHSLVVASLAEAAAERVGANALMCRVCALFHDIGKLQKPGYFIENQQDGDDNPHDALTPTMSALVIMAHVKDGVDLAVKHKLTPRVINVIQEHHGDSLVYYFYRRAQEQKKLELEKVQTSPENPDELPQVDEKNFRYPGPKPSTLESGIICLADSVESASRSLRKPTPAKVRAMIDELIRNKINTGQLDECPMTLGQLAAVKESLCTTLRSMLHARIDYPKDEAPGGGRSKSDSSLRHKPAAAESAKPAPKPQEPDAES